MNILVLAAAWAAAAVLVPVTLPAQSMSPQEKVTFAQWQQHIQKDLARGLYYPNPMLGRQADTGIVRVKFNCSDSGRPDKVSLMQSSGSAALDRAALRAVSHIVTLHPLPQDFGHGQAFQAVVMFDSDGNEDAPARRDRMLADAAKANARFGNRDVVTIAAVSAIGN